MVVKEILYYIVMVIRTGSPQRGAAPFYMWAIYIYSDVDQEFYSGQIALPRSRYKLLFEKIFRPCTHEPDNKQYK